MSKGGMVTGDFSMCEGLVLPKVPASFTPPAPGAGAARIYFKPASTAGKVKLVVQAGTSNTESTIADNLGGGGA